MTAAAVSKKKKAAAVGGAPFPFVSGGAPGTAAADDYSFVKSISCGPGPSGSWCAMPKWQSMQVMPSRSAFA